MPYHLHFLLFKEHCNAVNTCAWYQFDYSGCSHKGESVPSDVEMFYLKCNTHFVLIKALNAVLVTHLCHLILSNKKKNMRAFLRMEA